MRPILTSIWIIKKSTQNQHLWKRTIHSGLAMTSQEVATALRPFIFTVHPDRFWNHPKEKSTNEVSLKRLNEFLGDKSDGRKINGDREETITFYMRNNNSDQNNEQNQKFEKVLIKLNHKENISTTVHRILSQCSLPTDYLKKINKQPDKQNDRVIADWSSVSYGNDNEFFYGKELFDEMELDCFRTKMEVNFSEWLKENHATASKKLEASLPTRIELTRLKQELTDELKLVDLKWNCDWSASHIRGALKNLSVLCKQYPEDLKRLHSRTVVFSRHNGVSVDGQVILNICDVRNNWLYLIRTIKNYDYYVKTLPVVEKELSDLLGGISIVHPEYNIWNAKKYFQQLRRLIQSIQQFKWNEEFPSNWPESLSEYRLVVEFDSGPLMLSPNGEFIVPASCPVSLLVRFLKENLNKARQRLEKEEFNQEHERVVREECIETFELGCLEKDFNITPEQMIDFCRRILDNREKFQDYLKSSHIQVSMYYSVMNDGQICVPFNFIV